MILRKKLIAGNWKMNKTPAEALVLAQEIAADFVFECRTTLEQVSALLTTAFGALAVEEKTQARRAIASLLHRLGGARHGDPVRTRHPRSPVAVRARRAGAAHY